MLPVMSDRLAALSVLDGLDKLITTYRNDPVFFAEHALGIYTWSKMRDVMNSVMRNKYTGVRACHGSSKTFTAAAIATWFFNMFPQSKVITTAPTGDQVRLLLWTEIGKIYRTARFKLIGECQTMDIRDLDMAEHFAHGFSTDRPQRAEGWHAPEILFILDEAKGIAQWMWDSMKGAIGGGHARVLAISTTDGVQAGDKYHAIFTNEVQKKLWNRIHIDIDDLPTFTGEKMRTRDYKTGALILKDIAELNIQLSTPEWKEECGNEWGEDSVLYLTKVRGEIVDETPRSIIRLSQVRKMFDNYSNPDFDDDGREEVGIDCAREGDDFTVAYKRKGMKVVGCVRIPDGKIHEQVDEIERKLLLGKKLESEMRIKVDDTGVGGGFTDELDRRGYKNVIPVNFGQNAKDRDLYKNAISEMWFELAEKIERIACPDNARLMTQLTGRMAADMTEKGQRVVEKKSIYKKRMKESPDDADAFLLCFYEPEESGPMFGHAGEY